MALQLIRNHYIQMEIEKKHSPAKYVKAHLHLANFSHANDTIRWQMLPFQSPFEENEIWINCKAPVFCLLKIISFLIIRKSAENLKLLNF